MGDKVHAPPLARRGLLFAVASYTIWGFLPLYFHALTGVSALLVLAHRVVWSVALLTIIVLTLGRTRYIVAAARGRTLLLLCTTAILIAINWLVYIWAVQHDHVLEASLGYFINPLISVALGVVVLRERLRRWQGVAIAIAALGVAGMAVQGGAGILISLALALTFAIYGLLRKVAVIDSLGGLTVETMLLTPVSLVWVLHTAQAGSVGFDQGSVTAGLLGCGRRRHSATAVAVRLCRAATAVISDRPSAVHRANASIHHRYRAR
jgi:chloramphenicol-sensitive protein RarD